MRDRLLTLDSRRRTTAAKLHPTTGNKGGFGLRIPSPRFGGREMFRADGNDLPLANLRKLCDLLRRSIRNVDFEKQCSVETLIVGILEPRYSQ